MNVAIIDAGGANLASVRHAFERLQATVHIAQDVDALLDATHVVLPGVGAAPPAMRALRARGFEQALREVDKPVLGICLGMQLLFDASEEGATDGLGLLPGRVRTLVATEHVRVPHMGWNTLLPERDDPLLEGLAPGAQAYFVHGFAVDVGADCIARAVHGAPFAAVVRRGRLCGTQFHPERSGAVGARVLRNFLDLA